MYTKLHLQSAFVITDENLEGGTCAVVNVMRGNKNEKPLATAASVADKSKEHTHVGSAMFVFKDMQPRGKIKG